MSDKLFLLETEGDFSFLPGAEALLEKVGTQCVRQEGIALQVYAHLMLTDDDGIQTYNREYRHIDKATDVLSFPSTDAHPGHTLGQNEKKLLLEKDETGRCFLGDIIISLDHARAQAQEYGHSLTREMAYLTCHALFHLMGYDHMREEDKTEMRKMEEASLNACGIGRVTDAELLEKAKAAMQFSYSPYSHFKVGAALLCDDGAVYTGCNIENASYGATNCAERTALFKAVSEGKRHFTVIAIAAEKEAPWPCGICRQALNEFAPALRVIVTWDGQTDEMPLAELLPHGFGPAGGTLEFLGK